MKKKEKQAVKHELFLQRTYPSRHLQLFTVAVLSCVHLLTDLDATGLEQSRSPYSKSHERRLKRKAREQVAGGLKDITAALAELETDIPVAIQQTISADDATEDTSRKSTAASSLIGEGKRTPLSKAQRKKAL